jgi:hypothetical protein
MNHVYPSFGRVDPEHIQAAGSAVGATVGILAQALRKDQPAPALVVPTAPTPPSFPWLYVGLGAVGLGALGVIAYNMRS